MISGIWGRDPATRIRRFSFFVLLGLGIAVAYHAAMKSAGLQWPWTSFLFSQGDRYNDWHNSVAQAASGDPYFFRGTPALAAYFPGAYLIFGLAANLGRGASTLLYVCISEILLFAAVASMYAANWAWGGEPARRGRFELPLLLVLALQCSYPLMFAMDRGNIDLWIACGCTIFVATQTSRCRYLGLTLLAFCIAAKGYPAAFLLLPAARRDWTGLVFCAAVALCLSLAGLLAFRGGFSHNLAGLQVNLNLFYQRYILGEGSLFASSDPYNAIRLQLSGLASVPRPEVPRLEWVSTDVLTVYSPFIFLYALLSAWFVLAVPVPAWRSVTAVCLVAILFPNVATDYKLCCLFPGLLLLLMSDSYSRREFIALGLFSLLMIPKSYYFFNGHPISMYINPALLIALAWQVLGDRTAWAGAWHPRRILA
jgi:hypothetical protein